jgi:hypothetical protein
MLHRRGPKTCYATASIAAAAARSNDNQHSGPAPLHLLHQAMPLIHHNSPHQAYCVEAHPLHPASMPTRPAPGGKASRRPARVPCILPSHSRVVSPYICEPCVPPITGQQIPHRQRWADLAASPTIPSAPVQKAQAHQPPQVPPSPSNETHPRAAIVQGRIQIEREQDACGHQQARLARPAQHTGIHPFHKGVISAGGGGAPSSCGALSLPCCHSCPLSHSYGPSMPHSCSSPNREQRGEQR